MHIEDPMLIKEERPDEKTNAKIIDLMEGKEIPKNHFHQQIVLSTQLYKGQNPEIVIDPYDEEERKMIMKYWEDHGYAEAYGDLREKMNPLKITLEDLIHYKLTGQLPHQE